MLRLNHWWQMDYSMFFILFWGAEPHFGVEYPFNLQLPNQWLGCSSEHLEVMSNQISHLLSLFFRLRLNRHRRSIHHVRLLWSHQRRVSVPAGTISQVYQTLKYYAKVSKVCFVFSVCLFSKDALSGSKLTVKTFIMFQKISSLIINTVWTYYPSKNPGGKWVSVLKTNMKRNNGFQHY